LLAAHRTQQRPSTTSVSIHDATSTACTTCHRQRG
jgi:hypothetical protein